MTEQKTKTAAGFRIQDELAKLPKKPGVYIMHNEQDAIIYVGRRRFFTTGSALIFAATSAAVLPSIRW